MSGKLVVLPTQRKTGFSNGTNGRDVAFLLGTIGQGVAGNLHHATNKSLFSLIGANPSSSLTELDMVSVNFVRNSCISTTPVENLNGRIRWLFLRQATSSLVE